MNHKRVRTNPDVRRAQILKTGVSMAAENGLNSVTRTAVSDSVPCSPALISHYFDTIAHFRIVILQHALEHEVLPILAEDLAARGRTTAQITPQLRKKIIGYLTN